MPNGVCHIYCDSTHCHRFYGDPKDRVISLLMKKQPDIKDYFKIFILKDPKFNKINKQILLKKTQSKEPCKGL